MRLGVLIDRLAPAGGGAEAHTDALVRRTTERGHEVVAAHLEGAPPPGVRAVPLGRVPRRRPSRDRHLALAGVAALRDAGCDVVYAVRHALACDVYLPHGGLVADAWAARDAARGGAGRFARLAARWSRKRRFFREAEAALLAGDAGPRVIAVSRALGARIASVYPKCAGRIVVVGNGVDADRFQRPPPAQAEAARAQVRRSLGIPADAYLGLLLAHDPWLKGLATAVEACGRPEVRSLAPAFHLLVAGRRAHAEVERLAARAGAAGLVHVEEADPDPRPFFLASDVLVHPTWHDPCSLVCLEALAMEVPVITTARNGVAEVMGARGGIVLERPGDADALARAIVVLADPALRGVTGEDARYLAEKTRLSTRLDRVIDVCLSAEPRRDAP